MRILTQLKFRRKSQVFEERRGGMQTFLQEGIFQFGSERYLCTLFQHFVHFLLEKGGRGTQPNILYASSWRREEEVHNYTNTSKGGEVFGLEPHLCTFPIFPMYLVWERWNGALQTWYGAKTGTFP